MKKNTIKAFTLVEMLIVIVIIGILIASLMPRMQSAQWRARDVARKNDLAQIQTAIITSQQDKWKYPGMWTMKVHKYDTENKKYKDAEEEVTDYATEGMSLSQIADYLKTAWMTQVPTDPNGSNSFKWIWQFSSTASPEWEYMYMVTKRNSVKNGWFVLMAKTEVEWGSNWLVCDSVAVDTDAQKDLKTNWRFKKEVDLKDVVTCSSFEKVTQSETNKCTMDGNWKCTYTDDSQLRYILVY